MSELKEIHKRKAAIRAAGKELATYIERRWPVGSPVTWDEGGHLQYGEVLYLGRDRLKVRNDYSGRSYWIDIYNIELALKSIQVKP